MSICCNIDILIMVLVLHWVTAIDGDTASGIGSGTDMTANSIRKLETLEPWLSAVEGQGPSRGFTTTRISTDGSALAERDERRGNIARMEIEVGREVEVVVEQLQRRPSTGTTIVTDDFKMEDFEMYMWRGRKGSRSRESDITDLTFVEGEEWVRGYNGRTDDHFTYTISTLELMTIKDVIMFEDAYSKHGFTR